MDGDISLKDTEEGKTMNGLLTCLLYKMDRRIDSMDDSFLSCSLGEKELLAGLKNGTISYDRTFNKGQDNLLVRAVKRQYRELIKHLLANHTYYLSSQDFSPLTQLAHDDELCRLFVVHGCSVTRLDFHFRRPIEVAEFSGNARTAMLFYAMGARSLGWPVWQSLLDEKKAAYFEVLVFSIIFPRLSTTTYGQKWLQAPDPRVVRLVTEGPTLAERCLFVIECAKIRQEVEEERKKIKK